MILPVAAIIVCFAVSNIVSYMLGRTSGATAGFIMGKQFILVLLKHLSPDAAAQFESDVKREYSYEIYSELDRGKE